MTDPASGSTIERTEALWKLCKGEVTLISLAKHGVLLTLVSDSGDESRPDILLRAFKEVARMGRLSVLLPADATPLFSKQEAEQIAAAGEMLGLGDNAQFSMMYGENEQARQYFWESIQGKSRLAVRKLRAVAWEGNTNVKTAERNAKAYWFPTFLKAVEH